MGRESRNTVYSRIETRNIRDNSTKPDRGRESRNTVHSIIKMTTQGEGRAGNEGSMKRKADFRSELNEDSEKKEANQKVTIEARNQPGGVVNSSVRDQLGIREKEIMELGRRRQVLIHAKAQLKEWQTRRIERCMQIVTERMGGTSRIDHRR
jgi:hypothetical protein